MTEELSLKRLTFAFSPGKILFDDFSFTLFKGDFAVLAGCNGCGKSTFMRLACGFYTPQKGSVILRGRALREYSGMERSSLLGFVPQNLPSTAGMTVAELVLTGRAGANLLFGLPVPSRKDRLLMEKALADMDILHLAGRSCDSLSGGEFKRAAIAAILAREPEILLLDEPCSFLDYPHSENLMRILSSLQKERSLTICMISHELALPAKYASRFILMKDGRIFADGTPEKVLCPDILEQVYTCPFEVLEDSKGNKVPVAENRN